MPYSLDLLAASGVKVLKRAQWGARYPVSRNTVALPGRYLFMHITVTHQTGTLEYRDRVVERIGASRFPNTNMSYTALLHKGGEIHEGQPRGRKGAHTINDKGVAGFPYDLNAAGHALAYVGNVGDSFGEAETEAAARWAAAMVLSGESRATEVLPHNKFAWKECPAAAVMKALPEINRRFRAYVAAGRLPNMKDEDDMTPEQAKQLAAIHNFVVERAYLDTKLSGVKGSLAAQLANIQEGVWQLGDGNLATRSTLMAQIGAVQAALAAVSVDPSVDVATLTKACEDGATAALSKLELKVK